MSAATDKRSSSTIPWGSIDLPVKAATKIVGGTIVCTDADGWAVPGTATTGLRPWGRASREADNTDGGNGAIKVNVQFPGQIKVQLWENDTGGTPVTAAMRGKRVYILDNQTLTATSAGKSPGPYVYDVTSEGVWAWFDIPAGSTDEVAATDVTIADSGNFTAASNVEAAFAELYQNAITVQGHIDLLPNDFRLLTGAPLALFADGASAVPGTALVDSKALGVRWNNNATLDGIMASFLVPPDMDITANATVTIRASKTGATLADAVTFDVGAFNQVVGALHDADANFGSTSTAMTGNATAKTIQAVTATLTAANLAASPASVTMSIKPTDGTLGTDDLVVHSVRISYKQKLLTS